MTPEEQQKQMEITVFQKFIDTRDTNSGQCKIENRPIPEPDILYTSPDGTNIAFELFEVCSEEIAETISRDLKKSTCTFIRSSDPSADKLKQKLGKSYETQHPMELLLYTNGRAVSPDDVIIANCDDLINLYGSVIQFQKIWFWGDDIHLLHPRT